MYTFTVRWLCATKAFQIHAVTKAVPREKVERDEDKHVCHLTWQLWKLRSITQSWVHWEFLRIDLSYSQHQVKRVKTRHPKKWRRWCIPASSHYSTRNFDPNNYNKIVSHNQDYFRFSYFPRSITLWNSLPPNIKTSPSLNIFKTHLAILYKEKLPTYQPP